MFELFPDDCQLIDNIPNTLLPLFVTCPPHHILSVDLKWRKQIHTINERTPTLASMLRVLI